MALCDESDINLFLDASKVVVTSGDDTDEKRDAEAIIRAHLAGKVDATVMAGWINPTTTPEIIRGIAGRFAAAFRYRKLTSEDSPENNNYAQMLYNEAQMLLDKIANGNIEIPEVGNGLAEFSDANFYPTFQTGIDNPNEAPQFDWNRQF